MQSIKDSSPEFEQLQKKISNSFRVDALDKKALDAGIKLHLVLKQMARDQDLAGFATECWSAFPRELGLNPCMGFIEDSYSLACEGDMMLCISLLIVRYLTGVYAYAGDLFDLDMDNILTLVHCGGPASLASDKGNVNFGKSQLASERGFETLTCRPHLDPGPVTVFRFYGQECNKLHLASGELVSCETSPNLTVKVKIAGNRQDFLDQCLGNHYLIVPGDTRTELKLLCKWFGITIFET
jgi:L-fucose isomerase-like protein